MNLWNCPVCSALTFDETGQAPTCHGLMIVANTDDPVFARLALLSPGRPQEPLLRDVQKAARILRRPFRTALETMIDNKIRTDEAMRQERERRAANRAAYEQRTREVVALDLAYQLQPSLEWHYDTTESTTTFSSRCTYCYRPVSTYTTMPDEFEGERGAQEVGARLANVSHKCTFQDLREEVGLALAMLDTDDPIQYAEAQSVAWAELAIRLSRR